MQRHILGFGRDDEGDWAARLGCGHNRHVRHRPPFINRPWVMHAAGRASWLGRSFDCLRCDRLEWPARILQHRPPDRHIELDSTGTNRFDDPGAPSGDWRTLELGQGHAMLFIDALHIERPLTPDDAVPIPPNVAFRLQTSGQAQAWLRTYRLI